MQELKGIRVTVFFLYVPNFTEGSIYVDIELHFCKLIIILHGYSLSVKMALVEVLY